MIRRQIQDTIEARIFCFPVKAKYAFGLHAVNAV